MAEEKVSQLLALVEAAKMARTRLQTFADHANRGEAQAGGRELSRKIWGAFAEFDAIATGSPPNPLGGQLICQALGFDPTNHHNAAKCPYCSPEQYVSSSIKREA